MKVVILASISLIVFGLVAVSQILHEARKESALASSQVVKDDEVLLTHVGLLERLGVTSSDYHEQSILLVLHRGIKCVQCMSQLSLLGSRENDFRNYDIQLIGVCPEMPNGSLASEVKQAIGVEFPLVTDPSSKLFEYFDCVGSDGELLHGLFLIRPTGEVAWRSVSGHANSDIDEILSACAARVILTPKKE